MGTDDNSGKPLWMPQVLTGGGEKAEAEVKPKTGARLLWHLNKDVKESDTEFEILTGDGELKFKVIGKYEDAAAVIDAFRLREKLERNAMRLFLEQARKRGADFSNDPTLASYTKEEADKLQMFYAWMTMLGLGLITSGARPWDGKVGESDDEQTDPSVAFSIVKNDGGAGGDSTSN